MNTSESSDSLTIYYRDVEESRMLSAEEERGLITKYLQTKDAKARDLIIRGALRYVIAEARKHPQSLSNRSILEDLIAAGNIGLLRALNKFDPNAGTRFLTYASWWVRHEMREESRRLGLVHVPAHAIAKGTRSPNTTEFTDTISSEDDDNEDYSAKIMIQQSLVRLLELTELSTREIFIIKSCYGIHTGQKTLKQIGKVLEITGERVRQLRESAITKLRNAAQSE